MNEEKYVAFSKKFIRFCDKNNLLTSKIDKTKKPNTIDFYIEKCNIHTYICTFIYEDIKSLYGNDFEKFYKQRLEPIIDKAKIK